MSGDILTKRPNSDQQDLIFKLAEEHRPYCCPGETQPISNAVHHARLRAHYPKCEHCPHQSDSMLISEETRKDLTLWQIKPESNPTIMGDGFRGLIHNDFRISKLKSLISSWSRHFRTRSPDDTIVMIGHDHRIASLELISPAIQAVIDQGLNVYNVGRVTTPTLASAMKEYQVSGGFHLTGCGGKEWGIGIDFYGPAGMPLSGESLHQLDQSSVVDATSGRGRKAGAIYSISARERYVQELGKQFKGLHCPHFLITSDNPDVLSLLKVGSCRDVSLSTAAPEEFRSRLQSQNTEENLLIGVKIAENGQSILFVDAGGEPIAPHQILTLLISREIQQSDSVRIMLGEECRAERNEFENEQGIVVCTRESLRESFYRGMPLAQTSLGYDAEGRYWFYDQSPVCDGLFTLAKVMQCFDRIS